MKNAAIDECRATGMQTDQLRTYFFGAGSGDNSEERGSISIILCHNDLPRGHATVALGLGLSEAKFSLVSGTL